MSYPLDYTIKLLYLSKIKAPAGLEPAISTLTVLRSNQLDYRAMVANPPDARFIALFSEAATEYFTSPRVATGSWSQPGESDPVLVGYEPRDLTACPG